MNHLPTINFQVFLTQLRYAQITNIVGLSSQCHKFKIPPSQKKTPSEKKKTKKMTLQRPSWTKKTKKNSTVARLPKPLPGRNSFSLAVGWAVFAGVRSTEWNRSYTWGKRSRRCNFWGVLGGGVAKRGKFDVSNGRKWKIYYGFGLCEKVASRRQQLYIETNY